MGRETINQLWTSNSSHAYKIGVDAFKIAGVPF